MLHSALALVLVTGGLAPEAPPVTSAPPPSTEIAPPSASPPVAPPPAAEGAPVVVAPSTAPAPAGPPAESAPAEVAPTAASPSGPVAGPPVVPPVSGDAAAPAGEAPPSSEELDALAEEPAVAGDFPAEGELEDNGLVGIDGDGEGFDARPAPPPPPPGAPPRPADGRKMLVAGGIVGGAGLLVRLITTLGGSRVAREGGDPMQVETVGAVFFTPLIATGMGLVGGAMGRHGHVDAHGELFENKTPRYKRRRKLGWGLFGAGMGVWALTRLLPARCPDNTCVFRTVEVGYYLSLVGTVPGIIMGSYASGYRDYKKRNERRLNVSATPMLSRQFAGVSISSRF